ncbi:CFAP45 [Symbiodinium sp. KB8]|nr:CFAP45 [Symbiodinium sp. KB8]
MNGFPIGVQKDGKYYLYNHLKLDLKYHSSDTYEGHRIVGFEIEPRSVVQATQADPTKPFGLKAVCQEGADAQLMELDMFNEVIFSYDVTWEYSDVRWVSRWDNYLKMTGGQIHWFSILNSLMIMLFLSGMVAMILLRTLYRDITKYNELATAEEAAEETGWKLVHGDVFRKPRFGKLLAVSVGSGVVGGCGTCQQEHSASVTVIGINGSTLLETMAVSSIQDLNQQVQAKLKSRLLQLAGLEDENGNLASDLCSMKDLEDVALQVAVRLAETGRGWGLHSLQVAWEWDDLLAAPRARFSATRIGGDGARQHMRVDFWSLVVPPGVRVIVSIREGSPSSEAARDFVTLHSLAVRDIVDIRRAHQRACDAHREELLARRSQADTVDALIMLRQYTAELVHFEVFHDVYNNEAEGKAESLFSTSRFSDVGKLEEHMVVLSKLHVGEEHPFWKPTQLQTGRMRQLEMTPVMGFSPGVGQAANISHCFFTFGHPTRRKMKTVQILGMSIVTLIFALLGFLSPAHRGGLLQSMMMLFTFMGVFGGYASARLYKVFNGEDWKTNTLMTAMLYPGVIFMVFFVLNLFIWGQKSSGAVPFTTMFAILVLWFGISVPLVFLGSYFGFRRELRELTATKMSTSACRLLTADGHPLATIDAAPEGSTLTAVAISTSGLLEIVGLVGDPVAAVPVPELETMALKVASSLASVACWFGGPGHLEGYPAIPWPFGERVAAPPQFSSTRGRSGRQAMQVTQKTPVVHAGVEVVFTVREGSLVPNVLEDFIPEENLTVRDIIKLRDKHDKACQERRRDLLATKPGTDVVEAEMSLKEYGLGRVHFVLGYSLTNDEEIPTQQEGKEAIELPVRTNHVPRICPKLGSVLCRCPFCPSLGQSEAEKGVKWRHLRFGLDKMPGSTAAQSIGSLKSQSNRYRTLNTNADIDETLFGNAHNKTMPKQADGKEVMIVGKDTVMVRKRYDRHNAKANPKEQAVVIAASELNRLRENAKLLSKEEEIEQKKREEEALAERQAKSIARKEKIRQMEEERKRNAIQAETAKDARGAKGGVLERAKQMLDEDMDDVKHMNQMMLYSKIVTIRDAQIQEKRMVQAEKEEEERHLDAMMEIERLKALKMYEVREQERMQSQRAGAKVIIEQIKDRQAQRMKEEEQRDQERSFVLKQIESLKAEEVEQQQQKKLAAERLMQEVNEANGAAMKIKEERMLAEKLEEQKIIEYQEAKEQRERDLEAEKSRLAADKERETARLRAMQEKAQDKAAEMDALRAKRAMEAAERAARQKEAAEKQKQDRMNADLKEARFQQQAEKERRLGEQAKFERDEFERIIEVQMQQEEAERQRQGEEHHMRLQHAQELRHQISAREEKAYQERRDFLEDGNSVRASIGNERKKLEKIKARKIEELKKSGVPEKYWAELARKKISI